MIRKDLCAIAGMRIPTFNTHRRNGDLPFDMDTSVRIGTSKVDDSEGRTWTHFNIHHAARMLAARHLADAHSISWSSAAKILREKSTLCGPAGYGHTYFDRPGIFVAQVSFANARTNAEPILFSASKIYEGPLNCIVSGALEAAEAYNRDRAMQPYDEEICVTGMVSVDLSHHWRLAKGIAADLGIDTSFSQYLTETEGAE